MSHGVVFAEYFKPYPIPFWKTVRQVGVEHVISGARPLARRHPRQHRGQPVGPRAARAGQGALRVGRPHPRRDRGLAADGQGAARPPAGRRRSMPSARSSRTWAGSGSRCFVTTGWAASTGTGRRPRSRAAAARSSPVSAGPTHRLPHLGGDGVRRPAVGRVRVFLRRVVPVAERAGVRLALHPDDPPIPELRGVSRVMISVDAFERALTMSTATRTPSACARGTSRCSATTCPP